jgi:ComF family protein
VALAPPGRMWKDAANRPLRTLLDSFATLVFPSDCRICGNSLLRLARIPVCDDCLASLVPADVVGCSVCGESLAAGAFEISPVCGLCSRAHPRFDFAISFSAYDGTLRRLLHLFKYEQLRPAANVLGGKLAEAIARSEITDSQPVLLVPVPLHRSKRRQRGFNQSELLAAMALRHMDRSRFTVHAGNLRRVRATVSQTGLTRHQRRENVRGAFVVAAPERVRDRSVIVVDDVYTTGTTLNECARVLRAAGAKHVVVATVARVYRSVAEIAPASFKQEEHPTASWHGAAAG